MKEECRKVGRARIIETFSQDIRYGLRQLRRNPRFTAVAILTLALGIGATFAIFSILYALALRPLPVRNPGRLVEIDHVGGGDDYSYAEWKAFRDRQNIFSGVFAFNYSDTNFNIGSDAHQRKVSGLYVSGAYFQTLGVPALIGRALAPSDDRTGAPPECVIGYRLWRELSVQSRNIIGRTILANGHDVRIVGVLPRSFFGTEVGDQFEIFMTLETERAFNDYQKLYGRQTPSLTNPRAKLVGIFGRLKPGENIRQANAGLQVLSPEIYKALAPGPNISGRPSGMADLLVARRINATSNAWLQNMDVALLLMAMAALGLIIACANLSNLLLARATKRHVEMAIRLALGATRGRLLRQLLTESFALSVAGAAVGLAFARWGARLLVWALSYPGQHPHLDLQWDARLIAFAVIVTLLCTLLFGLAPAMRATNASIYSAMNGGLATGKRRSRASNSILVVVQVALSVALLITTSLLVRTLDALLAQNPGYEAKGVVVADATWQGPRQSSKNRAFVGAELLTAFRTVPGVHSASWERSFSSTRPPQLVVPEPGGSEERSGSYLIYVSPDFFKTWRTPILAGREFDSDDTDNSVPVAILSDGLAKTLFKGANPVGRQFLENDGHGKGRGYTVEVVGVVKNIQFRAPNFAPLPVFYRPVSQCADSCAGLGSFQLRAAGPVGPMSKRLKKLAASVDPHIVLNCYPLGDMVNNAVHRNRGIALVATTFSLFVGVLGIIGVYGVTTYAVEERSREFGIRLALGARPAAVLRLALSETMILVCIGLSLGAAAGFEGAQMIRALLWGVRPTDPLSFGFAVCAMLLMAGIAAYIPARRATKVDPMIALRYE